MTVRNFLEELLQNNGMSQKQAVECMDFCIPKLKTSLREQTTYEITFDRPSKEYPNAVLELLFVIVKPHVKEWIELNIPNAWFKAMFNN